MKNGGHQPKLKGKVIEMKRRILAIFLVFTALFGSFSVLTSCDIGLDQWNVQKLDELPELTKGYFGTEYSDVSIDLAPYVEKNGNVVEYDVSISDPTVASIEVIGDTLTATLKKAPATATITVDVLCEGEKMFSWETTLNSVQYKSVACIGDSLTEGHIWAHESYTVYLEELIPDFDISNYGKNGASITGTNPSSYLRYTDDPKYKSSLESGAEIAVIMLGTNDSKAWDLAQITFRDWYKELILSYLEENPDMRIILVTAPPTMVGNKFNIPNDIIRDEICPIQREVAEELGLPLVDLRAAMEKRLGGYDDLLRGDADYDGVHLSVEGARFVAELIAEAIKSL